MFNSITIFYSQDNNPYVNLALEDQLLHGLENEESKLYVFFYINRPSIVFGNFQNPWLECDLRLMEQDDIWPVRRQSGGGAVYHDEGNLNFSFIQTGKNYDKLWNLSIIQKALIGLGIDCQFNERSDLILDGKKFSGSAFKQKKNVSMHHGTLLLKSDLTKLTNYLTSKTAIIESKSIKSVRSKVINLYEKKNDLNSNEIMQSVAIVLEQEMAKKVQWREIGRSQLQDHTRLNLWQTNDHIYGRTPKFVITFKNEELVIEGGFVTKVMGQKEHVWLGKKFIEIFSA